MQSESTTTFRLRLANGDTVEAKGENAIHAASIYSLEHGCEVVGWSRSSADGTVGERITKRLDP